MVSEQLDIPHWTLDMSLNPSLVLYKNLQWIIDLTVKPRTISKEGGEDDGHEELLTHLFCTLTL